MANIVTFNRRILLIVLGTIAQAAVPWLAAMLVLWLGLRLLGGLDNPGLHTAVIVLGVACVFFVRVPRALNMNASWTRLPIAANVVVHWMWILAIVGVVHVVSDVLDPVPGRVFLFWAAGTPLAVIATEVFVRRVMSLVLSRTVSPRNAVIAGFSKSSASLAKRLTSNQELFINFLGYFDDRSPERLDLGDDTKLLGGLADLPAFVASRGVDVVLVALPIRHLKRVMYMMEALHDTTVSIYYVPDVFVFDLIQSRATEIDGVPVVAMRETPFHGYRMIAKRALDIVVAFTMIIVLAPVVLVAAVLIKWSSPGPVIFKQRRYGLDGDEIYVYKLRTMRVAENGSDIAQATRADPRVTPIGRFLRRSSMDELPQLFNVLQGKMSLVGPRPHAVAHNEQYRRLIKGYMVRHKALPGITGLAQVSGCRGETEQLEEMERRVRFDLEYLRSWSLFLDLQILLLTVVKVWRDDKAY